MCTVRTYDNNIPARCFILQDQIGINFVKGAIGGNLTAAVKLSRQVGISYIDIAFGYFMEIVADDGDVVWEGTVTTIPQTLSATGTYDIGGTGRMSLLTAISGTWTPNYPIATELRTIITDGIALAAPGVSFTTASFPNTGVKVIYTPQNTASVRSHLDQLIIYGDSALKTLFWQVINGVFTITKRPFPLTTYDYKLSFNDCSSAVIGTTGDGFYTRVTVRWKDAIAVHNTPYNNTAKQILYGQSFGTANPTGTRLAYIREPDVIDLTGHGILTQAQADQVGNTLLNRYSSDGIRVTASTITAADGQAVRDFNSSQIIGFSRVQPGKVLMLADMPGSSGSLGPISAGIFIGQISYTEDNTSNTQSIEITAEDVVAPTNILAALIAQLPKEPA